MTFEENCKEIIERYGKQWDIKPHVLKGNLWWKDAMEDAFKMGQLSAIKEDLKFIENQRDKGNMEMGGFSAGICLSDLMKNLKKKIGELEQ